jgi:hypothetical protein
MCTNNVNDTIKIKIKKKNELCQKQRVLLSLVNKLHLSTFISSIKN